MVRKKNTLAATDPTRHVAYKKYVDNYWGIHSQTKLVQSHQSLVMFGTGRSRGIVETVLFHDPLEAEFFRDAMRLLRPQVDGEEMITYEKVQSVFRTYIQKAKQATLSTLAAT